MNTLRVVTVVVFVTAAAALPALDVSEAVTRLGLPREWHTGEADTRLGLPRGWHRALAHRSPATSKTGLAELMQEMAKMIMMDMLGMCSEDEFEQISNNYGEPVGDECDAPEEMCQPQCFEPLSKTLKECESDTGMMILKAECGSNEYGHVCLSVLLSSTLDIMNLAMCPINGSIVCSRECRQILVRIKEDWGCCFGNFYNSSSDFYTKYLASSAIANISNYRLWESCGVQTPGTCLMGTTQNLNSGSKSNGRKVQYGPLIALLLVLLLVCVISVVVFIHRRKLSIPRWLTVPKGFEYHKVAEEEETQTKNETEL